MKRLLVFVLLFTIITSCTPTTFYQLIQTKGIADNSMDYQDENCIISYDFWSDNGTPGFTVYNKGNQNLYIDLSNSFFNKNNYAYDYFLNREFSRSKSMGASNNATKAVTGINNWGYIQQNKIGAGISSSRGESITYIEKDVICIPPKTKKYFNEYSIISAPFKYCDMKSFPANSKKISSINFDFSTSPIIFGNIISYKVEDGKEKNVVENKFYINKITNYPSQLFRKDIPESQCPNDNSIAALIKVENFRSTDKFYIKYSSSNTNWLEYITTTSLPSKEIENKNSAENSSKEYLRIASNPKIGDTVYFDDFYNPGAKIKAIVIGTSNFNWVTIEYKNRKEKTKTKNIDINLLFQKI